jgi:vitamin B12 transporter
MRKIPALFVCLFSGLLSLCLLSVAQAEEVQQLAPIIISADRISQPIAKSTSSVTLITRKELEEESCGRIDEILRGTPGICANSSGTMGETVSIRLRGNYSNQTLVLIDGMKVNSPWDGIYGEWGDTDLADIGRIEIIRGTQSELYGSEAIGGVVHLFTQGGKGASGTTLSLGGGNFETRKGSIECAGGEKSVHYLFAATRTNSQGQFDNDDAYRNTGLTARIDWQDSQAFSLKAVCRYRHAQKELAVNPDEFSFMDPKGHQMTFFRDDDGIRRDHFFLQTLAAEGDPCHWWHYRLNAGYLQDHVQTERGLYYGTANQFINDVSSGRISVGTQHDFTWPAAPNTFSLGLEYERESADGGQKFAGDPNAIAKQYRSFFDTIDKSRNNLSLFFQNRVEIHPLTLTVGFRRDNNSVYGDVLSPRLTGSFCIDRTKTRLKASWAKGFRAPSFQELYYPELGNPTLKPEKSTGFETGVEQPVILNKLAIGCTYFHTRYKDLISKVGGANNLAGAATVDGIEGELAYDPLPTLKVRIDYTWLDSQDKKTQQELSDRPHNTWKIAADYSQGRFSIHPVINVVSSEYSNYSGLDLQGNPFEERNPGYTRVDVTAQYEIPVHHSIMVAGSRWQWYIRINNLFDEEYCEVQGFPAPGTNFLSGITGTF